MPTEALFLCFISFFSVRGEWEAPSGSLEEWVKVDRAKRPDFLLPQEPYAESLLLLDMASEPAAREQQLEAAAVSAATCERDSTAIGNALSRGGCRVI